MDSKTAQHYCSYCGYPIDVQVKECPNCGRKYRKSKKGILILAIVLGLILISVAAYFVVKLIPTKQLTELSSEEVYQLASPATVEIRVETEYGTTTGTGFFDSAEGTIITNFHVLEDATSGSVYLNTGERFDILKLVGFDRHLDIAIVQIDYQPTSILQARTDLLQTGETVYALGSSVGLADSFSQGIISANQREIGGQIFIQTTAPISHGNSGGPLIDKYGKVVGITTAGIETGQNLNLAVPISSVDKIDRSNPVDFLDEGYLDSPANNSIEDNTSVICSEKDKLYHKRNCSKRIEMLAKYTDGYFYLTPAEAILLGYEPCPSCH